MTAERWQQVEAILQAALDISSSAERAGFIEDACAGDADLHASVERLISADDEAESFIESPAWTDSGILGSTARRNFKNSFGEDLSAGGEDSSGEADSFIGRKVGVFELKKELGRGGMGAVYLATREDGEFRQRVAVKLIKRGMDTDFIVKRFRHERQILAALNHPNIAALIDGGTSSDGLPYFVMEYVEGKPLYNFCDERKLNTTERLRLFRRLCEAVEAAHELKVVHRDLKPSNVLVKTDGTPKLLDFGIAKILDSDLASATLEPTATAMRLMTPEYASPEQVCGEQVSPASDIYSLGVLLYELLTGHRPYRFRNRAMHEIHRAVCEEQPSAPSESLTRDDNLVPMSEGRKTTGEVENPTSENTTLAIVFRARNTDFENLRRELAGDLDKIILKTLRKDPLERYQTASELAADITRFLEKRPVEAESFGAPEKILPGKSKTGESGFAGKPSAAILPFKMLGASATRGDTDSEEFLGIGLADALITRLSVIRQIVVRPTSSVLAFSETTDPFRAGRELTVDFVVDGNIRRNGTRIRVSVQLLSVTDNSTLWAQTFDENFTDVLSLEDSISERVAKSLLPQLTGEEQIQLHKRGTNLPAAYEAYLRGRYFWNHFTPETFPKALEWFEKAVALDENYALAYVGIADFYIWATIFGMYSPLEGNGKTRAAAEKALELDNQLSEAHAVLGFLTAFSDFDWTAGERLFKHALELNPHNALAHEWFSALLAGVGRNQESEREILHAHALDPLSLRETTLTAWHLYQLRRFPEALAKSEEIIEMNPLYYQGFFQRGNVLIEMNRAAEAVADLRKALEIAPGAGYLYYKLCFALVAVGERDEAQLVSQDFEKLLQTSPQSSYHMAMCYAALDDRDRAFEWFDKALENRDMWVVWLATEPKLDELRGDERFNELLRKTNRAHLIRRIAKTRKTSKKAIKIFAVLPFRFNALATGDDTDEKFLGLGLTDALITRLSKTDSLIVRPTSSVLNLAETADAFSAGRQLAADFVLDGNIRRIGTRIRVSAQLLDVNESSTAWAETFDEKFTDILEVEDSIAERVAKSLLPQLTGDEQRRFSKRGTDNPAAYEAYLRGRFHWNQFTPESLTKALESFKTAIELDPNYALPYVGVADFYSWANIYGLIPTLPAHDEAERAARRAIELDPGLGEAYASLGLTLQNRMRWAEAEKFKLEALRLNPNYPYAHEQWAGHLIGTGREDEGVKALRGSESLDPLGLRTKTLNAWMLYQAHRFNEALAVAQQIVELDKNYPQGYSQTGFALWAMKRYDEALANFQKLDEMIPNFALAKYQLCFGLAAVNRHAEARAVLNEMKTLAAGGYVKPYFLAMAHVAVGERDAAFRYFEQSFDEQEPWLIWFGTDPMFESLHDDVRFVRLLERMENPIAARFKARREAKNQPKTFAVLPFKLLQFNTGDNSEDQFLSVGLIDALITRLSKFRRIVVRPTSAVVRFSDNSDAFQAGVELEADFVLAGNIRRAGNRVRVSAQLLKVADKSTAWAETFDEKFTDVLSLEDSIAERVAKSLLPQLTGEEQKQLQKRETNLPEAYEAYLKGRFYWSLMTEEGFGKAIGFYERAVALDPNYALAYAAIAEYYIFLAIHCVIPFSEASRRTKDAAERAAAIDPHLSEAQAALGLAALNHDFDWNRAEGYLRRAIEINPNSILAHSWYQSLLLESGRFDEMQVALDRVLELHPEGLLSLHYLAWAHFHTRRYDESTAVHRRMLKNEPNYAWGHFTFSWLLRRAGEFAEAVAEAKKGVELAANNPMYLTALAAAFAEYGQRDEALETLDSINRMAASRYVSPYMLAIVYCSLGNSEQAFELLEKALAERDVWVVWLYVDPQFDRLRDDARFNALLRRMNHPLAPREKFVEIEEPKIHTDETSIAVLPLKLLSSTGGEDTGDDNFLSVGLADALITRLSNVRRFVVRPTSSVLPYGKNGVDSFAAGRELGVDFVVDGGIRRVGTRIRVTAQLLSVRENAMRWAQNYDEDFVDVLTLEDSISEQIAKSLLPHLSGEEKRQIKKRGTDNPEAFEAYLRGRHYWNTFTEEGFAKSLIYYNQAISIAPDYALAYAGIADYYNFLGVYAVLPFAETSAAAKEAAQRAIELDSDLAEAYAALGFATLMSDFDWEATERHLRRATELNPNYALARIWYSYYLGFCGRSDEALTQINHALEVDRYTPMVPQTLNWVLYHARRYDEAIEATRRFMKDEPRYGLTFLFFGSMLWHVGQFDEAIKVCRRAVELLGRTPYTLVWLASSYAASGQAAEAKKLIEEIKELSARRYVSPYLLAMVYINLKDTEKTFEFLEKAWEIRDARLLWLGVDPQFDALRGEPRFDAILRQTNNPLSR